MPHAAFVPLRIFSSYTMLEGAIDPKKIAKQARALGFPAAAITDRNGLYGSMAFSDACKSEGVQPLIGAMSVSAIGFALRFFLFDDMNPILRSALLLAICGSLYLFIVVVVLRTKEPVKIAWRVVDGFRHKKAADS